MHPLKSLDNQRGFTLILVLIAVVIMGLMVGIAGSTWSTIMQQEREEELLWRGQQYMRAIESYARTTGPGAAAAATSTAAGTAQATSGPVKYPNELDHLLKDPRFTQTVRHIRRLYKDPMTGEDFELVRAGGTITGLPGASQSLGGITGVRSTSTLEPFKKDNFTKDLEKLKNAASYRDWEFVYVPKAATPAGASGSTGGGATSSGTAGATIGPSGSSEVTIRTSPEGEKE